MAQVIFYEKPGCGGNARQKSLLQSAGHTLDVRDLLSTAWTQEQLLEFMADLPVPDWFNRAAPAIKSGQIIPEQLNAAQALALLLEQHLLIRRPLMQVGTEKMVGWNEEKIAAWIGLTPGGVGEGCPKGEHHPKCP